MANRLSYLPEEFRPAYSDGTNSYLTLPHHTLATIEKVLFTAIFLAMKRTF